MSTPNFQPQGGDHPPHGPAWKRMHHSPFFWVSAVCILLAMTIYVMTNNLAIPPASVQSLGPASVP